MRDPEHPSRFERELSSLKETGSSLLLVGTVPRRRFYDVAVNLLGDTAQGPRRRVLVGPDEGIETQFERLTERSDPLGSDHVRAIQIGGPTRSAATKSSGQQPSVTVERVSEADLSEVGDEVLESIKQFESVGGPFVPAELRVGVDGVTSLLKRHGTESVFRLAHLLNALVKQKSGMIHYVLPLDREGDPVRTLAAVFDAVVELRMRDGELEQQWELLDSEITSEWVAVDNWDVSSGTRPAPRHEEEIHEF